jgi:hypothetical protein
MTCLVKLLLMTNNLFQGSAYKMLVTDRGYAASYWCSVTFADNYLFLPTVGIFICGKYKCL